MRKKTIGEVLKLARMDQGLSLEDLANKTDIQIELLEAIENNDYDRLPSPFYARSFLRKYAWAVDLDESIILDAYEEGRMIVYEEVELADGEDFRSRKNKRKSSFLPLFYLLLVAFCIVIFVTYYMWTYAKSNDWLFKPATQYTLVSETTSQSSSKTSQSSSVASTSSSLSNKKIEVSGSGSNLTATVTGANQTAQLKLSIKENTSSSWISVSDTSLADGTTLSADNPSQTVTLSSGTTTTITLGVTSNVSVMVDDQKIDTSTLTSESGTITLIITQ
ncbi:MAG: cytoskeleton protein RodZ [Streptococcus sp.]|nr:cytoskeleton protein RodZ [Streptococcus sp.]